MDNQKIGNFIAQMRKEQGLTQKELGSRLNVSDRAVSKWERGLNLPDASLFEPLCRELDITLSELLRGERETATMPQMEQVVSDTVALAKKKERAARRNRWIACLMCVLVAVTALWCGKYIWEGETLRRHYRQDNVIPGISLWYATDDERISVDTYWGGHHAPLRSDATMSDAELRVHFPPDSSVIKNLPPIRVEENHTQWIQFGLSFEKEGLEVKVLHWPKEAVGTKATLEQAEQIPIQPVVPMGEEQGRYPLVYGFEVKPDGFYSIVYFWGDGYWLEYPFRTTK